VRFAPSKVRISFIETPTLLRAGSGAAQAAVDGGYLGGEKRAALLLGEVRQLGVVEQQGAQLLVGVARLDVGKILLGEFCAAECGLGSGLCLIHNGHVLVVLV